MTAAREAVKALSKLPTRKLPGLDSVVLPEHPFDGLLLSKSALYRRSRVLYVGGGGVFRAALASPARTLGSAILLEQVVEYAPVASELAWPGADAAALSRYVPSLFHEQNHRILWRELPPSPASARGGALSRYLNFAEALVIGADMALGDELGCKLAAKLKALNLVYDPGTTARADAASKREYRNYLHACVHATWLVLEGYAPRDIANAIPRLYENAGKLAPRAAARALNLNHGFIARTNVAWKKKHGPAAARVLGARSNGAVPALVLSEEGLEWWRQYAIAESWFAKLGV